MARSRTQRSHRIYVAGDSTATNRPYRLMPMVGWGQVLPLFLVSSIEVRNCARGAASSVAFWDRGRFQWILDELNPGDRVLVSLGQVDADHKYYTDPWGEYQDYLRACIVATRQRGAYPVVVLSHDRRSMDPFGHHRFHLRDHREAGLEVAAEESCAVVDLYEQSQLWWGELNPEQTKDVFVHRRADEPVTEAAEHDNTHVRAVGATECARFIVRALIEQRLIPADWAVDLDREYFSYAEVGWLPDRHFVHLVRSRVSHDPPPVSDVLGVSPASTTGEAS